MPQGVGHRYVTPWSTGNFLGFYTSDAIRRFRRFQGVTYLIREIVLGFWGTLIVTLGWLLWAVGIVCWQFRESLLSLGRILIAWGRIAHCAGVTSKNFGNVLTILNSEFRTYQSIVKKQLICDTGFVAGEILAKPWTIFASW
jgi:hypothetical protein